MPCPHILMGVRGVTQTIVVRSPAARILQDAVNLLKLYTHDSACIEPNLIPLLQREYVLRKHPGAFF